MVNAASTGHGVYRAGSEMMAAADAGKIASAGVNMQASMNRTEQSTKQENVTRNLHQLGDAVVNIADKLHMEASEIRANNLEIKAKQFKLAAASATGEQENMSVSFNMELPVGNPNLAGFMSQMMGDFSVSSNAGAVETKTHQAATVKVAGKFSLQIKDGEVIGSQIEANILDISAENLLVKSVQDTIKSNGSGFSLSLDPKNAKGLKGLYGENGEIDSAVLGQLGSIVGREATNIVVKDTLTMAGGLIANASRDANGNLTNKGQAQVKASKLIVDKLHDYDGGYSLGLGLGSDIRTKFALKDKARDLSSALVNLQVTVDGEIIGLENLDSEFVVPKMSGTDIDLDVTFASSIIRNEPKVDVAPATPPDDEELVEELAREIGELCQEAADDLTVSQMVASAAVSDVAFVVPNLEHNKAEVLGKLEAKLTSKYGEKLAKFVVTRLAPKFIPLVGQATLAKDVYDAVKEFEELSGLLEKRKAEDAIKKQERSKVVATDSGSGDNDDEPEEDPKVRKKELEQKLKDSKVKIGEVDYEESTNAGEALKKKMRAIEKAQANAVKVKEFPDGRIRYYTEETLAAKPGPTRGRAQVTEYNPKTGQVRYWSECYDQDGNVNRVHPKMIDGQDLEGVHYPLTGKEMGFK